MTTATQTCEVVLPGYTITNRIGAGGYAEVWRAEAPGGIHKAVKIVHGYYDDEFASQELKALERIKGVRHPFLLSLERFEILSGRLVILTELADISLDQRLRQCRAEGLSGIPRDELLRYMSDAAEALDFLSQRHQLLHLDIKPENLLVLGDHIKVADFGLVKELATRTQNSLVSGLTPTYASPEMFDDDPSIHSDQYSLAIVYQEMLLGTLPFPGRTAAQLAKQHTQAEPQLGSLPTEDRPVIARALAKQPTDRFPSCRAFVDALMCRVAAAPTAVPREVAPAPAPPYSPAPAKTEPDDTRTASVCTTLRRGSEPMRDIPEIKVTQPVQRQTSKDAGAPAPPSAIPASTEPEETADIPVPAVDSQIGLEQPTLYVAIGGVGVQVLCKLRACAALDDANEAVRVVALDTDRNELRDACSSRWPLPLASEDTLHLPLRLPTSYDNSREILGWLSRRWLYNIPRSLETRGYRPLGRIALVDNAERVFGLLDQKLQELATALETADATGQPRDAMVKVALLIGTGGGTGAGMAIDVANAARSLAAERGIPVEVHGYLICTCLAVSKSSPLEAANTYSLLAELNHATTCGNVSNAPSAERLSRFESHGAPFDFVYAVPVKTGSDNSPADDALEKAARYLALDRIPAARAALRSCRDATTSREQACQESLTLKSCGCAPLGEQKRELLGSLAVDLAQAIRHHWLAIDSSADWQKLVSERQRAPLTTPAAKASDEEPDELEKSKSDEDSTPIGLRGRFQAQMSLEFASEVLRQIQFQLDSRDNFGRPLIPRHVAVHIVDAARAVAASLVESGQEAERPKSTELPAVQPLISAASRRVIRQAVESFDPRRPEQFLPLDKLDELLQAECRTLLEESYQQPDFAATLTALVDLDRATSSMIEAATPDLLQCGNDRRTIVFAPDEPWGIEAAEKLRSTRPTAGSVTADVDDVIVVVESAGISPRSFALGLERVFPGIANAAQRLLTRIDVDWKRLVE